MFVFQKTMLASLLLLCNASYAGTMGSICKKDCVDLLANRQKLHLGGGAIYLQPSYGRDNLSELAYEYQLDPTHAYSYEQFYNQTLSYNWGFRVEAAYDIGVGKDISANWSQISSAQFVDLLPYTAVDVALLENYYAFATNWNAVNIELGQALTLGASSLVRFHAGFEYVRLVTNSDTNTTLYNTGTHTAVISSSFKNSTDFNGFGPRIGADLTQKIGFGFSAYANAATGLMTGNARFQGITPQIAELAQDKLVLSGYKSAVRIVAPELEAN